MKKYLLAAILLPAFTYAQRIKVDETDNFNKKRRIQTSVEYIRAGFGCQMGFYIRSIGDTYLIGVKGSVCAVGVIGEGDKFDLLLDNDSVVTVFSRAFQSYEINQGGNKYEHEYIITLEQIQELAAHELIKVRAHLSEGYDDITVKEKGKRNNLGDLCKLFLKTLG